MIERSRWHYGRPITGARNSSSNSVSPGTAACFAIRDDEGRTEWRPSGRLSFDSDLNHLAGDVEIIRTICRNVLQTVEFVGVIRLHKLTEQILDLDVEPPVRNPARGRATAFRQHVGA